jgi:hypothetical protein
MWSGGKTWALQQTASLAKEAALKSAELAAETARLAKEGQLLDTIKEKTKQVRVSCMCAVTCCRSRSGHANLAPE